MSNNNNIDDYKVLQDQYKELNIPEYVVLI